MKRELALNKYYIIESHAKSYNGFLITKSLHSQRLGCEKLHNPTWFEVHKVQKFSHHPR
jgi:hypothetical protein